MPTTHRQSRAPLPNGRKTHRSSRVNFQVGERIWWRHTPGHIRRGTITALEERPGVNPDDDADLLYLDAEQLHPQELGIFPDIPEDAYHSDRGSLSASGAKLLLPPSVPAKFRQVMEEPPEPKPHFDFGTLVHTLVLGKGAKYTVLDPNVHGLKKDGTIADNPSATTAWKQADQFARESGKIPVHLDDFRKAEKIRAAVLNHPIAGPLFTNGAPELSMYATDPETGVKLRARVDWLTEQDDRIWLIDLKTSATAHPGDFARRAAKYRYHVQAAFYRLVASLVGLEATAFVMVAVEKTPPYLTSVIEWDSEAIAEGHRLTRQAIETYARCNATSEWPGYPEVIHPISLPIWAFDDEEMEFTA